MGSQPRARDRRCPGHADRGNQPRCEKSQRGVLERRKPYRAPDPRKLGWSGPERGWATQKPYAEGNLGVQVNGAREIPVVLVDRRDCRRRRGVLRCHAKAGGGGEASMEGALTRRDRRPLTRRRWRRVWRSLERSATEGVRGWQETVPVAEYATGRERHPEGSRSGAHRSGRRWSHWETEGRRRPCRS